MWNHPAAEEKFMTEHSIVSEYGDCGVFVDAIGNFLQLFFFDEPVAEGCIGSLGAMVP